MAHGGRRNKSHDPPLWISETGRDRHTPTVGTSGAASWPVCLLAGNKQTLRRQPGGDTSGGTRRPVRWQVKCTIAWSQSPIKLPWEAQDQPSWTLVISSSSWATSHLLPRWGFLGPGGSLILSTLRTFSSSPSGERHRRASFRSPTTHVACVDCSPPGQGVLSATHFLSCPGRDARMGWPRRLPPFMAPQAN
jgi:hypothetical protein